MPSGGRRQGKPGRKYANRTDMRKGPTQPARAATGQDYGTRGAQLASQAKLPLSQVPSTPPPAPQGSSSPTMAAPGGGGGGPQIIPSLTAPTTRPNEPLTAGLASGPGPGPEALNLPPQPSQDSAALASLRGMYQAYPNSDIAGLIAEMEARG